MHLNGCCLLFHVTRIGHAELLAVAAIGSVLQKLLDQVNVGHDHATAAVALAAELIKGLSIGEPSVLDQDNELFPKVTHDLAT